MRNQFAGIKIEILNRLRQMILILQTIIEFLLSFIFMEYQSQMFRIFIIGTTAVGKTKLSVELAKHLGGQIISCDSKQLYKHASIMTAKVTQEQAQNIPHYMVDCLELHENTYNRIKYFKEASKAFQEIEDKKNMPIIVGGTNYYIETLLYNLKSLDRKFSSQSENSDESENQGLTVDKKITEKQEKELQWMRSLPKEEKYQLLLKYDKKIALKTHSNDEKRLTQFLERIIINGENISSQYQSKTSSLRCQNSIVFWVRNSDKQQLLGMVTKRIYKMLDKAGLSQIFSIYYYIELVNRQKNQETQVNMIEEYSGACSSIGVRQFKDLYLEVLPRLQDIFKEHNAKLLAQTTIDYDFIHKLILAKFQQLTYSQQTLAKCRDQLILDTKHYCKRQLTWIRNRMYLNTLENRKNFFVLELSQQEQQEKMAVLDRFDRQVAKRAIQIVEKIQKNGFGSIIQKEEEFSQLGKQQSLDEWKKYYCEACKLQLNGLYYWNCHIESKRHIKQAKYQQKKEQRQKYILQQKQLARQRKEQKVLEKDGQEQNEAKE